MMQLCCKNLFCKVHLYFNIPWVFSVLVGKVSEFVLCTVLEKLQFCAKCIDLNIFVTCLHGDYQIKYDNLPIRFYFSKL